MSEGCEFGVNRGKRVGEELVHLGDFAIAVDLNRRGLTYTCVFNFKKG